MITELINDDSDSHEVIFYDQNGKLTEYKKIHKTVHLKDNIVNPGLETTVLQGVKAAKSAKDTFEFNLNIHQEINVSTTKLINMDLVITNKVHPEEKPVVIPFRDYITEAQYKAICEKIK